MKINEYSFVMAQVVGLKGLSDLEIKVECKY